MITQSKEISHEYCCTVVKLGEIIPIEGANTVAKTLVNGREIVIGKTLKEGSIMIYASNESQLNFDFMSINNLFEDINLNSNATEVAVWLEQNSDASEDERKEYLRQHRGYFDKHARVRMKRLCKTVSMGFLFEPELLINWCPKLKDFDFASIVGQDFDTVNGELFVQAYIPPIPEIKRSSKGNKGQKKLARFDRMIPGQFKLHYDTSQLERNIDRIHSNDWITISVKLHGTSAIFANVLTKQPKYSGLYAKLFPKLPKFLQFTKEEYDVVYSSRTVIKNQYINSKVGSGFYGEDVWGDYYQILKPYIPEGFTIYGEIIGYVTNSNKMIQKDYDYKCTPGNNKLMIYRVSRVYEGKTYEFNVMDVKGWTYKLIDQIKEDGHPEIAERIHVIDTLYHGLAKDLYTLPVDENWNTNFLQTLKQDQTILGMELNEPLCRTKVPREGIVLRIDNDPINEAFKLKCVQFLLGESARIDSGEVDIELAQGQYGS